MKEWFLDLNEDATPGSQIHKVSKDEDAWRLEIPPGSSNRYRLAQLDDYRLLSRRAFPWSSPLRLSLRARSSSQLIAGTWGFGIWNDPFGMGVLSGTGGIRLPVLPNAAWFFFASPPSYLSLRDDLPAQGWMASTFRSPLWPSLLSLLSLPALPFLLIPPCVRFIRRLFNHFVSYESALLSNDPTSWGSYEIIWEAGGVDFRVNGDLVLQTSLTPAGPLGLVMWVDNQYAAVLPNGRLRYGFLPTSEPTWIEISQLSVM
jgi:hypothetical protein